MSTENTITRRNLLKTGGPAGLAAVAGCLEPDNNDQNNGKQKQETKQQKQSTHPNPTHSKATPSSTTEKPTNSTTQNTPSPKTSTEAHKPYKSEDEEIDAYISNQEFHETAIANQFTDSITSTGDDHIYPEEINIEGDTIELKVKTETPRNDMGGEIGAISGGVYTSALNEDEIPYNFDLEITDGNGETFDAYIESDIAQRYLITQGKVDDDISEDEEVQGGTMASSLQDQIIHGRDDIPYT